MDGVSGRRPKKGPDEPEEPNRHPRRPDGPFDGKKGGDRESVGDDPDPVEEGSEPTDGNAEETTKDDDAPPENDDTRDEERPPRTRPYPNVRFLLGIDGFPEAGFSACRVGGSGTEPLRYREGNEPLDYRLVPGTTTYEPVLLERGVGDAAALAGWRRLVEQGRMNEARRDVEVILLDEAGNPGPRWELRAAWPARYVAPDLDARDGDVAVETLELVHEGIERTGVE